MSRLTRDGTAEPVSQDQILRRERGQGSIHLPCSVDPEQDWQPYPVDPSLAICDEIHTYSSTRSSRVGNSRTGNASKLLELYLGDHWSCGDGLSVVNAIGM